MNETRFDLYNNLPRVPVAIESDEVSELDLLKAAIESNTDADKVREMYYTYLRDHPENFTIDSAERCSKLVERL